jgi:hypothetical protein
MKAKFEDTTFREVVALLNRLPGIVTLRSAEFDGWGAYVELSGPGALDLTKTLARAILDEGCRWLAANHDKEAKSPRPSVRLEIDILSIELKWRPSDSQRVLEIIRRIATEQGRRDLAASWRGPYSISQPVQQNASFCQTGLS